MANRFIIYALIAILALMMSSCSLTKGLADNDLVYMGGNISYQDKEETSTVEAFDLSMNALMPRGTRAGLGNIYIGIHNIYDQTGDEGFKHWVKYRLGEAPVLFKKKMIDNTAAQLKYYLNGKGFFANEVVCDSTRGERKVKLHCEVKVGHRYKIDTIIFPIDSTYAALKLDDKLKRAILKENTYYDRDRLDYERTRLSQLAGDIGFAEFGPEHIYYFVDTTTVQDHVQLFVKVLQPADSTYHTRYTLDSIIVYPNHALDQPKSQQLRRIPVRDGIAIYETEHYLDHRLIDRLILSHTGGYYNRTAERKSINRLLDLGLFKYINIQNNVVDSGKIGSIEQHIFITPEKMQRVSGEFEVNNRSGNFFGIGASSTYEHKNIFGHAERLRVSLNGAIESQFGDELSFINSSDINLTTELAFPRFIVPFINIKEGITYVPRTLMNANFTYQRRVKYYTLQSTVAKFGYRWRETARKLHELYPINLNQILTRNTTPEFDEILSEDARLKESFDDVLIAGLQYYFTYSNQAGIEDRRWKYFRGELETSGTLLGLIAGGSSGDQGQVGGIDFAQYVKLTLDYRRYWPLGSGDIAARIITGAGLAYGNSTELPYIKQYIVGGSNSIRAFRLRGLGPGEATFDAENLDPFLAQFVDQTGDIKLEMNVEYRFPVFNFIKGALFVDAGNVWLIDNDSFPEGNFQFDDFYTEIGVGTGIGFRLDFNFFLIRMDIAFPVRSPKPADGFQWRFSEIDLLNSSWRSDNLRYNLGIGYPF